jgi:hypothetical protein
VIRICGSDRLLKYADGASSRGLRVSLLLQDGEQIPMFSCSTYGLRLTLAVRLDIAFERVYQSDPPFFNFFFILTAFVSDLQGCYADPHQDVPLYQRG